MKREDINHEKSEFLLQSIIFARLFEELEEELKKRALCKICGIVSNENKLALRTFLLASFDGNYSEPEKSGKQAVFYEWIPPVGSHLYYLGEELHYTYYLFRGLQGDIIFSVRAGSGEIGKGELPKSVIIEYQKRIGFIENYFTEGFLYFKEKK